MCVFRAVFKVFKVTAKYFKVVKQRWVCLRLTAGREKRGIVSNAVRKSCDDTVKARYK